MVSTRWTVLTPILVAMIPIVAGYLIITPSPDKPLVQIELSYSTGLIIINNIGGAPATNITVFIDSLSPILTVNQYNPVNITLHRLNNSVISVNDLIPINATHLEFTIHKLVPGEAGFITLKLNFGKLGSSFFRVTAIYDQGSAVGKESNYFSVFSPYYSTWFFLFLIIGIAGEIFFFIYVFHIHKRKKFIKSLLDNLTDIRKRLITKPGDDSTFKGGWKMNVPSLIEPKGDEFDHTNYYTRKYIKDISDFTKVDDILDLISKREGKLTSAEIGDLNREVLNSINNLFEKVDWKKYQ